MCETVDLRIMLLQQFFSTCLCGVRILGKCKCAGRYPEHGAHGRSVVSFIQCVESNVQCPDAWPLPAAVGPDGRPAIPHASRVKIRLQHPHGWWMDRVPAWITWAKAEATLGAK